MTRLAAALLGTALLLGPLAACDAGAASDPGAAGGREAPPAAQVTAPAGTEPRLVPGAGAALAAATVRELWSAAPVAVLAPEDDLAAQARAAAVAVGLRAPLLLSPAATGGGAGDGSTGEGSIGEGSTGEGATGEGSTGEGSTGEGAAAELDRLGAEAVLAFGTAAAWAEGLDAERRVLAAPTAPLGLSGVTGLDLSDPAPQPAAELLPAVAALPPGGPVPLVELALPVEPDGGPGTGGGPPGPPDGPAGTSGPDGADPGQDPGPADGERADPPDPLPAVAPPAPLDGVQVLAAAGDTSALAAVATARAAGADVHVLSGGDPRADAAAVEALSAAPEAPVLALGDAAGPADRLDHVVAVARTGVQLPGGGQLPVPGKHLVALYGHPGAPALGVLGEQGLEAAIARAQRLAASYEPVADAPVIPTFEIITTIASAAAGADGDYSDEATVEELRPWVEAAGEAGVYVVLDLQPGRTDFLTQAQRYADLLAYPHVGLALDPEWRLGPDQRHLRQIGTVTADEVDSVSAWLADLVRERALPQKLLLLHQFRISMISDRDTLDLGHPELAVLVQMDGHGTPGMKRETWGALTRGAAPGLLFGWKNFYDEDSPTWTPAMTLDLEPTPWFVSYQ